jgi:hypothetical protein
MHKRIPTRVNTRGVTIQNIKKEITKLEDNTWLFKK